MMKKLTLISVVLSLASFSSQADVVAFGDSLSDVASTYSSAINQNWYEQLGSPPFPYQNNGTTGAANYAVGGAVSGAATDYVYKVNGSTLTAQGLLGQVNGYVAGSGCNTAGRGHMIWVGTNDMVIASQLDPFTLAGDSVTVTTDVSDFRDSYLPTHTDVEYYEYIINNYTLVNIDNAIDALAGCGAETVMIVGAFDIGDTDIPANATESALATDAAKCLNKGLKYIVNTKNSAYPSTAVLFADVFDHVDATSTFDEIHLSTAAQTDVLGRMYYCVTGNCASSTAGDPPVSKCDLTYNY